MTDAPEIDDQQAHAAHLARNATDTHRIRPDWTNRAVVDEYLEWHTDKLENLVRVQVTIEAETGRAVDAPWLDAQIAHHAAWVDRLTAKARPVRQRQSRAQRRASAETAHAQRVSSYAHTHGLSLRQAAELLTKEADR